MSEPEVTNYKADCRYAAGRPGRYVMSVEFDFGGKSHAFSHECNNPEVGRRILFEREADIIDPPAQPKRKRAA